VSITEEDATSDLTVVRAKLRPHSSKSYNVKHYKLFAKCLVLLHCELALLFFVL